LGNREALVYPFTCPNWLDLRIGFFLSICSPDESTIGGLAETLATAGNPADRFWVGVKQNNDILPNTAGTTFAGFTNSLFADSGASSRVVSSDQNAGTTNSNFWQADRGVLGGGSPYVLADGTSLVAAALPSLWFIHHPQDAGAAGGNATLILMRLTRASGASTTVTASTFLSGDHIDYLYDSVCLLATIRAAFRSATWSINTAHGDIVAVPDTLFLYWPFNNSRLRCHALAIEKFF
jgi:hypothetical protein